MRREGVLLLVEGESMLEREDIGELTGGSRLGVDIVCLFVISGGRAAIERGIIESRWKWGRLCSSIGRGAHFRHMQL